MSPLDASFLHLEDGVTHMHIASCALFDGPAPAYTDLVEAMAAKLPLVPRYRQVARFVPFQLGRPVWVDDPHFKISYHVRHTALPAPGDVDDLKRLMGRVMSQELDRNRPLWETWLVEGLADGRWALISKVHHCMVDGVSGTDLMAVMLDATPEPARPEPDAWAPAATPSSLDLARDALVDLVTSPYELARAARSATRTPRAAARQVVDVARGLRKLASHLAPTPSTSIVGTIGPHRRWTWVSADLADVKTIKTTFGGSVNDVVLAAITRGFRDLLLARNEPATDLVIRSLIPVSVRQEEQRGQYNNLVSAMFCDLPVAIDDPIDRLAAVCSQMAALKTSHEAEAGVAVTAALEYAPSAAFALLERGAARLMRRLPQHSMNTVTTNVPGPQFPLYACGRLMTDYLPYVPLGPGVRIGVAILSYNGRVAFGITGDYDTAPDIEVLAAGIDDGLQELLKLAEATG